MASTPGQQPSSTAPSTPSTPVSSSYLIIGAGCFGASTALHLARSEPGARITLLDRTPFPCPSAAAHDLNKIIRSEYTDEFYMRLALEAIRAWKSDPIFSPYFQQTGILFATTQEHASKIVENYTSVAAEKADSMASVPVETIEPEVARGRFGGIFRDTDWDGVETCLWNAEAGWGDAENALRNVISSAIALGVKFLPLAVDRLLFDQTGGCLGARTVTGVDLHAEHIILCTGAGTAKLLADSAPGSPRLQVGGRLTAAAAVMCAYRVPADQMAKFGSAPIVVKAVGDTPGESIPPGKAGLLKCTHELSFTNTVYHGGLGDNISIPPEDPLHSTWSHDVPSQLKIETERVRAMLYGKYLTSLVPEFYRMCW
ncbi:sarcosine oxidase [Arthroderma uncinatum]|uniref:sarcosine oxidase n=1 Tax=Arthroderma uncinatum TaxID=74035 RepID=UPI00144ADE01|nr:sarcosine oxidase [Arthroderma uncinatum]KAF3480946.1 sarcosine oxidase [Arthroderma uncinatum]